MADESQKKADLLNFQSQPYSTSNNYPEPTAIRYTHVSGVWACKILVEISTSETFEPSQAEYLQSVIYLEVKTLHQGRLQE